MSILKALAGSKINVMCVQVIEVMSPGVLIMVETNDDIVEFTIWKRIFQGLVLSLDDTNEDVMEKIETECLNRKVDVHFNSSRGSKNVVVLCIKEW